MFFVKGCTFLGSALLQQQLPLSCDQATELIGTEIGADEYSDRSGGEVNYPRPPAGKLHLARGPVIRVPIDYAGRW